MAGFLIHGISPGPFLFRDHPDVVWSLIANMLVASVMLLILNLPLVRIWVAMLRLPQPILFTVIVVFTTIGTFSVNSSLFDVAVMLIFSVIGYVLRKLDFPMAPIALTLVLGPQLETALGQSLVMSEGSYLIFLRSPISVGLLLAALLSLSYFAISARRNRPGAALRGSDSEA
jgi:putative tricarboxylic transport membrane protein